MTSSAPATLPVGSSLVMPFRIEGAPLRIRGDFERTVSWQQLGDAWAALVYDRTDRLRAIGAGTTRDDAILAIIEDLQPPGRE